MFCGIKVFPSLLLFFILMLFKNFCSSTTNVINFNKENLDQSENNAKQIYKNKDFKRNYDEYPMVVPKRAALLLDRLMIALQNALEGDRNQIKSINEYGYDNGNNNLFGQHRQKSFHIRPRIVIKDLPINFDLENGQYDIYTPVNRNYKSLPELKSDNFDMDLMAKNFQRRAHDEAAFGGQLSRIYWRCYFNAITCF